MSQFKGKIIGKSRQGSIHDVILRKLINDSGLNDDITIENFDWADFILDAMMDGEADGACGTPPLAVLAIRQLGANILLPICKVWPFNPGYGIIATEKLIPRIAFSPRGFSQAARRCLQPSKRASGEGGKAGA